MVRWGDGEDATIGGLELEAGGYLPDVTLAYETWGTLNADGSNAVLIEHALTGSTHVTRGDSDEPGWWEQLAGPGAPVDTDRFFVVSINIVGGCYGSTGPSSAAPDGKPWGSRFPLVTLRDTTAAEARLADQLGIRAGLPCWAAPWAGRARWSGRSPFRSGCSAAPLFPWGPRARPNKSPSPRRRPWPSARTPTSTTATITADRCPRTASPWPGALRTSRTAPRQEFDGRFGRSAQVPESPLKAAALGERGRYQVESYLDHQGKKLVSRFDANSYIAITDALMSHDVTRGRGSLDEALGRATARFFVAAVDSDRLYFPSQSRELADALPGTLMCTSSRPRSATTVS